VCELSERIEISRVEADRMERTTDEVVATGLMTVSLNGFEVASLLCTPSALEELAVGFLASEQLVSRSGNVEVMIIRGRTFVADVTTDEKVPQWMSRTKTLTSGCGRGASFMRMVEEPRRLPDENAFRIPVSLPRALMDRMKDGAVLFKRTGGVHVAALARDGELLYVYEDIGRHNAVDKVLGKAFRERLPLENTVLLSSGRLSVEIVGKAVTHGVPVLVSRAAPTTMAVAVARKANLTLVGFVRGNRMNIYSGEQRFVEG